MKIAATCNIFTYSADLVAREYAGFLRGESAWKVCVVANEMPGDAVQTALANSMDKLGYGHGSCWYLLLTNEATGDVLDAEDVLRIIEGIDPLIVVGVDMPAMQGIGLAYKVEFPECTRVQLLGRNAVGFKDFAGMLGSMQEKQRAWAALKLLGKK